MRRLVNALIPAWARPHVVEAGGSALIVAGTIVGLWCLGAVL